jgi:cell cycle checkpoint protein
MSSDGEPEDGPPIFKAVSSSARQLFQLLNCMRFASKVQVQISNEGLRFAVEESRVMQGHFIQTIIIFKASILSFSGTVFLDKALFTSFNCSIPVSEPEADKDDPDSFALELPNFQISLSALLETLQIFGAADASTSRFSKSDNDGYGSNIRRDRPNAFSNQALGMLGICRLSYIGVGSPFRYVSCFFAY